MPLARWTILLLAIAAPALAMSGFVSVSRGDETEQQGFTRDVLPLLVNRCLECHGAEAKGGLDLRSRKTALAGGDSGVVLVPGKPDQSLLHQHVADGVMPPKKPLAAAEVEVLDRWIRGGAYLPEQPIDPLAITTSRRAGYDWWSLQPIRKPPLPAVRNQPRVRAPIDQFLLARLEREGLSFGAPADRATYIRRVMVDLVGLMPSYDEVRAFERDERPDACEQLVDRLLASPHYGERWGRHWLDVVRFAESNGFERDRIRLNFWPYRDYVIRAHNADKPFNQFVREQLAGDALIPQSPSSPAAELLVATGFLVAGPKNDVGTVSELEQKITRQDELDEFVSATCTTFLGLTVGCARCHDHKYDPIRAHDYYSLSAVFSGLDRADRPIGLPEEQARFATATAETRQRLAVNDAAVEAVLTATRERLLAERAKSRPEKLLPAVVFTRNVDRFAPVRAQFVRFTVVATSGNGQPCLDELEVYADDPTRNLALASAQAKATASSLLPGYPIHQIEHLNDGRYGNSQSWISNETGGGWAQIELPAAALVQTVVWGRDREGKFLDRLPIDYRIEVSLDGKVWIRVSSAADRMPFANGTENSIPRQELVAALAAADRQRFDQLQTERAGIEAEVKAIPALPVCYSAQDSAPRAAFVLHRGDVRSPGAAVAPAALPAIATLDPRLLPPTGDSGPERRLRLAEWIVDPRNPLTSRVLVNRIWLYHFGQGIVNTPNDFGFNGDRPSHPELLDWLAADLVEHGWSMKRLHRMIVLSEAYRQSSAHRADGAAKDADNRLLWRFTPHRIEAEVLRDAVLAASGKLNLAIGGPSFRLFEYRDGNVPDYVLLENAGPDSWRRAVYMFNIRTFQSPLLGAFDCPDPSVQTPKRVQSVTALQALSLLNNRFMLEQAKLTAERVATEAKTSVLDEATVAYRIVLARDPTAEQRQTAMQFIREHGLDNLCRVLLNTNEFLYVD